MSGEATPRQKTTATTPTEEKSEGLLRKLTGEPVVHFLAAGTILFGAYWFFSEEPQAVVNERRIEIGADDIRQMAIAWLAQGRPPLTSDQLRSLIDHKIEEEILFREGLALGLDRNDEIIKRRIAQKMDFLAADIADLQEPEKAELVEWFSDNGERFMRPPRVSFRQLYFSPDKRGGAVRDDALAVLAAIRGMDPQSPEVAALADPFMLRPYYRNITPDQMLKEFGPGFADQVLELDTAGWRGPVRSGYGWHLVWIDAMDAGRVPSFEEVETDVITAWRESRYREIRRAAYEEMRSRYTVAVAPLESVDLGDLRPPEQAATTGAMSQ